MSFIHQKTEKTNLADDDLFLLADSEDSNKWKKVKRSTLNPNFGYNRGVVNMTEKSRNRLRYLMVNGGINLAILGDSTEAGSGSSNPNTYGECTGMNAESTANQLFMSMLYEHPNFVPINDSWGVPVLPSYAASVPAESNDYGWHPAGGFVCPTTQMVVSRTDELTFHLQQNKTNSRKVTLYYLVRTDDEAATFDVEIFDKSGTTTLATATIDTYTAQKTFTAINHDVEWHLAQTEITLPSDHILTKVFIDNLTLVDRGSGVTPDGTAIILGAFWGDNAPKYENFAVSSTTLLESSAANVTRGVTTSGQLAKAQAFGGNVYMIGFGTNDSKDGVSTASAFEANLTQLVEDIKTGDPDAVIILATDPRGLAHPYDHNPEYNGKVRDVAFESGVDLLDVEYLFDQIPASAYADNVHPSPEGYTAIADYLFGQLTVNKPKAVHDVTDDPAITHLEVTEGSDSGGTWVDIGTITINNRQRFGKNRIESKLIAASTSDIELMEFRLIFEGFSDYNANGVSLGEVILDESIVSSKLINASAVTALTLGSIHTTLSAGSYQYKIQGKNYQLRGGSSRSWLNVEKIK